MIKAVLIDLDDTLIQSDTSEYFAAYLKALGEYGARVVPAEVFVKAVMQSYTDALQSHDPLMTLAEKFMPRMSASSNREASELADLFSAFYSECFDILQQYVRPNPGSSELLDILLSRNLQIVVATNPGFPKVAIHKRMLWGGISPTETPFTLITTLETMHFGKPRAEYFEEIMARLNLSPGEAVMVGDDWDNDIVAAAQAGLHTYWITNSNSDTPADSRLVSGFGRLDQLIALILDGWFETLPLTSPNRETLIGRLRAFPASIDALLRTYGSEVLECAPGEQEWSARDIICHLADHEAAEDRARLDKIVREENPFLSANYDPWVRVDHYTQATARQALLDFVNNRRATVDWLSQLAPEVWERPARYSLFGPTSFLEMVRFTTEHDLTHLRQIRRAIDYALTVCGEDRSSLAT